MLKKKVTLMARLTRGASGSFTGNGGMNADSEFFGRNATAEELETLQNDWIVACSQENQVLHKHVMAEFKKRIKDAGVTGGKAKLDFRNGNLNDRQLMLLVLVLSKRPVICRLEIEAVHITNQSLSAICNILEVQMKLCRDLDVDNRLQACFLGEVVLEGKNTHLDPAVIHELAQSCSVLKYANAIAYIRWNYLNDHAGAQSKATIEGSYLDKIWLKVVGKQDPFKIMAAYEAAHITVKDFITYEELEKVLICSLIDRGSLIALTPEQMHSVHFVPIQEAPSPARSSAGGGNHSIPHSAPHSPVPTSAATNQGLKEGGGIAMPSLSVDMHDVVVGDDLLLSPISALAVGSDTEQYRFYTSEDINDNDNDFTPYKPHYEDDAEIDGKHIEKERTQETHRMPATNSAVESTADLLGRIVSTGNVQSVEEDLVFGTQLDDDLLHDHINYDDRGRHHDRNHNDDDDDDSSDFDYDNYDQGYEQAAPVVENNNQKETNHVVNPFEDDAIFEAVVGQSLHEEVKATPVASFPIAATVDKSQVDSQPLLSSSSSSSSSLSESGELEPVPLLSEKKTVPAPPPCPVGMPAALASTLSNVDRLSPLQKQQQQESPLGLTDGVASAKKTKPALVITSPDAIMIPTTPSSNSSMIMNQSNYKSMNRASSFTLSTPTSPKQVETLSRSHSMTITTPRSSDRLSSFEVKLQELENNIRSGSFSGTTTPRIIAGSAGSPFDALRLRSDSTASQLEPNYEGLALAPAPISSPVRKADAQQNSPTFLARHQIILPLSPTHAAPVAIAAASASTAAVVSVVASPDKFETEKALSVIEVLSTVHDSEPQVEIVPESAETMEQIPAPRVNDSEMVIKAEPSIPQSLQPSLLISVKQKAQTKQAQKQGKAETKVVAEPLPEVEIEIIAQTLTVNSHQLRAVETLFTQQNLVDSISTLLTLNLSYNKLGPSLASLQLFTTCPLLTSLDLSHNLFKGKVLDNDLPRSLKQVNFASNQFVDVMGLMSCIVLQKLDLSCNVIKHIFGLPPTITNLNLAQNKIAAVSSLRTLSICSNLTVLALQGNSVLESIKMPRVYLKSFLLHLEVIDGVRIVAEKVTTTKGMLTKQQALSKPVLSQQAHSFANTQAVRGRSSGVSPSRKQQQQQEFVEKLTRKTAASIVRTLNSSFEDNNNKKVKMSQEEVDRITRRLAVPRASQHSSPPTGSAGARTNSTSPARKEAFRPSGSTSSPSRLHQRHQTAHDESKDSKSPRRSQSPAHGHNTNNSLDIQLKQWRSKKALQLTQIASLFRIPFAFIVLNTVPADHAQTFFEEVDFYQKQLEIPLTIRRAMHAPNVLDEAVLEEINNRQTLMQKSIQLLQQIQTAMMLTLNSEVKVDFPRAVDVMMKSSLGQMVNEQVLTGMDCYYTGLDALLPSAPITNLESNVPTTNGGAEEMKEKPEAEELVMAEETDYTHRIRDVENNEVSLIKSEEDSSRQQEALVLAKQRQEEKDQKEASMYMDRMRQRVAMRFMPPSLLDTLPPTPVTAPSDFAVPISDTVAIDAPVVIAKKEKKEEQISSLPTIVPSSPAIAMKISEPALVPSSAPLVLVSEPAAAVFEPAMVEKARDSTPEAGKRRATQEFPLASSNVGAPKEIGFTSIATVTADDTSEAVSLLPLIKRTSSINKPPLPPSASSGSNNQDSISIGGASKAITASERLKQRLERMRSEKTLNSAGSSSQDLPSLDQPQADDGNNSDSSAVVVEGSPLPLLSFYIESSSQEATAAASQQQARAPPFTSAYGIDDFTKQEGLTPAPASIVPAKEKIVEEQYPAPPSFSEFKSFLVSDPVPAAPSNESEAALVAASAPPTGAAESTGNMNARDRLKARLAQSKLEKQASLANVKDDNSTPAAS